jgi:hypothetical protein
MRTLEERLDEVEIDGALNAAVRAVVKEWLEEQKRLIEQDSKESFPNIIMQKAIYPNMDDNRKVPVYYGIERYPNRSALVSYIYKAEKELKRVLKPDGILWVRWCEMTSMNHNQVLGIFSDWRHCLTHEINSSS